MEDSTSQGDQVTDNHIPGAGNMVDDDHDGGADNMSPIGDTTVPSVPSVPNEDAHETDTPDEADLSGDATENEEPDTFDRAYVEKLRQENGKYRQRAQRADALARRLHAALVEQTGKLADASDLPFDEKHLDDADSLTAAIDELLTAKPHLAARRIAGDIGQGASKPSDGVNLLNILRGN